MPHAPLFVFLTFMFSVHFWGLFAPVLQHHIHCPTNPPVWIAWTKCSSIWPHTHSDSLFVKLAPRRWSSATESCCHGNRENLLFCMHSALMRQNTRVWIMPIFCCFTDLWMSLYMSLCYCILYVTLALGRLIIRFSIMSTNGDSGYIFCWIFFPVHLQTIYEGYFLLWYNVTFTALPILLYGWFEIHIPMVELDAQPKHYLWVPLLWLHWIKPSNVGNELNYSTILVGIKFFGIQSISVLENELISWYPALLVKSTLASPQTAITMVTMGTKGLNGYSCLPNCWFYNRIVIDQNTIW